jgi:4-hydroxyphenylpyruvate dioxygenase-like putative hemolysin
MNSRGFRVIYEDPVVVDRFKATFLHPSSFGGVLFELIEDTQLSFESETRSSTKGIGVERILGVGILVEDLDTAVKLYSEAFSCEVTETLILNKEELKARICRVGNVDLVLIGMSQGKTYRNNWFAGEKAGLHNIVMKVGDFKQAIEFLENTSIDFVTTSENYWGYSDSLFLELTELGGIPVLFKEKSREMVARFS